MKLATLVSGAAAIAILAGASAALADGRGGPGRMGPRMNFQEIDANSDGKVTQDEMKAHAESRFKDADANGDGALSAEEMVAHQEKMREQMRQARMARGAERMIKRRDTNGDGVLSLEEMGPKDGGNRMFSRLDTDGDGAISTEEFEAARERMAERRREHKGPRDHEGMHRKPQSQTDGG